MVVVVVVVEEVEVEAEVEEGCVLITEIGVLCSQLPTVAVVGNKRDLGNKGSL